MFSLIKSRLPNNTLDEVWDNLPDVFSNNGFVGLKTPKVDIVEQENKVVFKADLPGLEKENIKVTLESGVLTIAGERKQESSTNKNGVLRSEVSYGSFSRSFSLDCDVQTKDIKANYKNGVLVVEVPKQEPKAIESNTIKVE